MYPLSQSTQILLQNSFIEFWLVWACEGYTEILYPDTSFVQDYCLSLLITFLGLEY